MTRTYCLPVNITINDENPNEIVKEIAETIDDGIEELLNSEKIRSEYIEVDYSIFVKTRNEDFI